MNSFLLSNIQNPNVIMYATSSILTLIFLIWFIRLEMKLKRLLGTSAKNIEESLVLLRSEQAEMKQFRKEMELYLATVEARLRKSVQGVETIRFNPFKGNGSGGNQSFATAFVNEKGNGVIFSSLYGHDRVSVFSKPVTNFKSSYELSEEEKQAMDKARQQLKIS